MPHSTYQQHELGSVVVEPATTHVAGSTQTLTLTYTAGKFGIDDTGGIKIAFRQSSDMQRFQTDDAEAPGFVTAEASNGAVLSLLCGRYNIRPYQNTVFIRVVKGFLRPGESIRVTLGAGRGIRLQTAAEKAFPLKVLVDAFATHDFVELPASPALDIEPGEGVAVKVLAPGRRHVGEAFRLGLVPTDRWTNPTNAFEGTFRITATLPVEGLPETIAFERGKAIIALEGLRCAAAGELRITLTDVADEARRFGSNPTWVVLGDAPNIYWADLHAQSGETVGAGTAAEYFAFARDKAFLDATGHQGNDFQITDAFWVELNRLYAAYQQDGRFVTLPGYEWSGNTGLGGDHNVYYTHENGTLHRSSKVLTFNEGGSEAFHITDLFKAVDPADTLMFAHVGGRYADIAQGHDGRLVRAVEVHSSWGTFEWILHDALKLGHRPGVVANSDDHKCRPGLTTPGAAQFGAMGGLTGYFMKELSRQGLIDAIRSRRCYGTSGARILIDLEATSEKPLTVYGDDPALGPTTQTTGARLVMGQVASGGAGRLRLEASVAGTAPIERLDVFDGVDLIRTVRPWQASASKRVRVLWQGAEYRGRGRETKWDGSLDVSGNRIVSVAKVNDFHPERAPRLTEGREVAWNSITTGNLGGLDLMLAEERAGTLSITTGPATLTVDLADVGFEPVEVDAGGLGRKLSVYRLPEARGPMDHALDETFDLSPDREHALYLRVTQEDGHQAWTSPIYLLPSN